MTQGLRPLSAAALVCFCLLGTGTAAWGQEDTAEGSFTVDGETVAIEHVTVHEWQHPFEEGQTTYLLTLSEQQIPYLEVDQMCPGEYGNRLIQVHVDREREVLSTNYCFQGGNSSGQTFDLTFDSFGPREYSGTVAAEFDVFDSKVAFDLRFTAPLPEELPGVLLPAGGGEPGAAYLAWTAAAKSGDVEKIKAVLAPDQLAAFDEMPAEDMKDNLEFLQMMAPSEVEVLGGRLVDDVAYLEVSATMDGEPIQGEIKLEQHDGVWVTVSEGWE